MAAAIVLMHIAHRNRERIFRDIDNPLDYLNDDAVVSKYRLSRPLIINLCNMFGDRLQRPTARSRALPVSLQVMVALRFYATGSFQAVIGDVHNISRASVSRVISDMNQCLVQISRENICMPVDHQRLSKLMLDFSRISKFPNTVGAIDGTHIRIKSPSVDEHLYVNRKSYHSINVQGLCDSDLIFLNEVARWPGGTHDSHIWRNSSIHDLFENGAITQGWLLGDSGYPLRPWLLTPVLNPTTEAQERYNSAHIRTRNVIEHAFGVLKSRFKCIDNSGGTLVYSAQRACNITVGYSIYG